MRRSYYSASIASFCSANPDTVLGELGRNSEFADEQTQKSAWLEQIRILQPLLRKYEGAVYFEYSIPRMGRRIDVVLLTGPVIFILEFKVGESKYPAYASDQVWDYALDLKNFHETSHLELIAPILVATEAEHDPLPILPAHDNVLVPLQSNAESLGAVIDGVLAFAKGEPIRPAKWEDGRYCPTPTIIEAATALYAGHSVVDISRNDAGAINLTQTSAAISDIIRDSKKRSRKAICFLTGVPGAGKTLVGLDIAQQHIDKKNELHGVYLSGNGPLVAVLQEALARDNVKNEKARGKKLKKGDAQRAVKTFIQNVHHFRDECLIDESKAPREHVALFDEAQRAWNLQQTSFFMRRKKNKPDFNMSEPEFLISCLNRHTDWAVIVCLVGGGQEINTGECGISEWIDALSRAYKDWDIYISPKLTDSEYAAGASLEHLKTRKNVSYDAKLHLSISMRSFRAEHVSLLVKQMLDLQTKEASDTLRQTQQRFPIVITRDVNKAKGWIRRKARGSDRYGLLASSEAQRLKPHAINVNFKPNPIHWFLNDKRDTRSSYYLEDVATEFDVQGLELDWALVTWDADFRITANGWKHSSFVGKGWNNIKKPENQAFLKNAYRVLLTRARQGMVILIPEGDPKDPTRRAEFYDPTFKYLEQIGFPII